MSTGKVGGLRAYGLETERDNPWESRGLCAASPYPDAWFQERASAASWAMRMCQACPVRVECLADAMATESGTSKTSRAGIRGGLTAPQRCRVAKGKPPGAFE